MEKKTADFRSVLYERYVSTFKGDSFNSSTLPGYHKWCDSKYLPYLSSLNPDSHILEIGCGQGFFLEYLMGKGFRQVEGIDISEEQIALATKRNLNVKAGDVFGFFEDQNRFFNCIVAFDLIEHFTKDEILLLVTEIFAHLKPGGIFLLQTLNGAGIFPGRAVYGDLTHVSILNAESLRQILTFAGFRNLCFSGTDPIAIRPRGYFRVMLWKMIKLFANGICWAETGKIHAVWTQNIICAGKKD